VTDTEDAIKRLQGELRVAVQHLVVLRDLVDSLDHDLAAVYYSLAEYPFHAGSRLARLALETIRDSRLNGLNEKIEVTIDQLHDGEKQGNLVKHD
jgi:hypothetical protein